MGKTALHPTDIDIVIVVAIVSFIKNLTDFRNCPNDAGMPLGSSCGLILWFRVQHC